MNDRLDHMLLDELRELMEDEFTSLLQAYLQDSEHQFHEASDAWEQGDLERLRRSVHSLKGASSNVGAAALALLCADLEELAVQGRIDQVPVALQKVRTELCEVRDAVVAVHHVC